MNVNQYPGGQQAGEFRNGFHFGQPVGQVLGRGDLHERDFPGNRMHGQHVGEPEQVPAPVDPGTQDSTTASR